MEQNHFKGIFAIPQVSFTDNNGIDYEETMRCIQFLLDCGVHGIVLPVYASEVRTLTEKERIRIVEMAISLIDRQVPVVAGISSDQIQSVLTLAEHACQLDADAVIAYNPTTLSGDETKDYFKTIDHIINIPLFIQNLGPAFGGKSMSEDVMKSIIMQSDNPCYIKEEGSDFLKVLPKMTGFRDQHPEKLLGVFGGQGGRFLFEEFRRGSNGTMPPSQLADIMVDIWNLLETEKEEEAFDLYQKVLPLLLFFGNNKIPSYKEILKRRGIFSKTVCRPQNWPVMDNMSYRDLDFLMEQIQPYLRVKS